MWHSPVVPALRKPEGQPGLQNDPVSEIKKTLQVVYVKDLITFLTPKERDYSLFLWYSKFPKKTHGV